MTTLVRHEVELRTLGIVEVVLDPAHEGRASAFLIGQPGEDPLVRVQSRCLYGEVFGSVDCDCRDQLDASMSEMNARGGGIVIYLEQEGRGLGLVSKARGYELKATDGLDTFAAYEHQGLPDDGRRYDEAVSLLHSLGVKRARLLTNNPLKSQALSDAGIPVTREPLIPVPHARSLDYLAAKRAKGHLL